MRTSDAGALLHTEHAVAQILAGAQRLPDVAKDLLAAIGEPLGWAFGAGWSNDDDCLTLVDCWSDGSLPDLGLAAMCSVHRLEIGQGLPGRVCASGEPAWIVDVTQDRDFPRRPAASAAGLRSALCFPIRSDDLGVAGAIEFFTRERLEPDERLLATVASLGRLMGSLVDRSLSRRALRSSEAMGQAILEAALDAVVTIDESGRVVEFNPAAERAFGYAREDAIGREMAELIVPPGLRERHRRGLARYLESGTPTILDRRTELAAMRSDGTEFPVELAITRIAIPGPPLFTGHIRDISDRRQAEAEVRESRARVMAASDAERRRIERDLHDGAQQQLVSIGLRLQLARSRLRGDPSAAVAELIDEAIAELRAATAELRELAHGIHPAVLTDRGLHAALLALASRAPLPVDVDDSLGERLPPPVEAAVYFVVAEALTNVARHAGATHAWVRVQRTDRVVTAEVEDDGAGGADPSAGSGLRGLTDRVCTLDGELRVLSRASGGTIVRTEIPCEW